MEYSIAREASIGRPKIPPFTIEKVLEMKEQGSSYKEITIKLKISKSAYYKILQAVK
jgi:DNA invertase Pin-like site-specific DNA recombinase